MDTLYYSKYAREEVGYCKVLMPVTSDLYVCVAVAAGYNGVPIFFRKGGKVCLKAAVTETDI
jgi:hypothetical protein